MSNPAVFEINEVVVRLGDSKTIGPLNLQVAEGEKVVIRGKSGSGKTTMLRLLLGFLQPNSGEARFRGEKLEAPIAWKLRKELAYVNQAPDSDSATVEDALLRLCPSVRLPDQNQQLLEALSAFDLPESSLVQTLADLSGGEKHRVALAAATLLDRQIFLLDEPTAALDEANKERVARYFLRDRPDWTVVVISHDEVWSQADFATLIELNGSA
ncbi:MAG: putative ABC transport system ATP-binding protein [Verrucomicrobiales bacterium]|jgi:putative ABC transport system ATP-binding protein